MRLGYFTIGLLVGVLFTSRMGIAVADYLSEQFEKDVVAYTLTGYHEGMIRGREYAERMMGWRLGMCYSQLEFYRSDKWRK